MPRNASRQAFVCRTRAFQVLNALMLCRVCRAAACDPPVCLGQSALENASSSRFRHFRHGACPCSPISAVIAAVEVGLQASMHGGGMCTAQAMLLPMRPLSVPPASHRRRQPSQATVVFASRRLRILRRNGKTPAALLPRRVDGAVNGSGRPASNDAMAFAARPPEHRKMKCPKP